MNKNITFGYEAIDRGIRMLREGVQDEIKDKSVEWYEEKLNKMDELLSEIHNDLLNFGMIE